ncbi:4Fe-4S dicluster domain-containing protein [Acetobacterium sp.]|uniref:4Fe-4S dicluster domain-containing protein n=1 Tax=Acetobacterium sp. TaxID=1872094 RepID=UPI000CB7AB55|nr:4Fe-4S dicluster domain-containing protein [Acetobacterium sp.]MDO9491485.1 SLBB domain-containing protein [Acetobacterium sp.]PKM75586.1 MAG: electron transport complex protein RnfC [Firmicutes bacterium HGW-Firmicutes-17]
MNSEFINSIIAAGVVGAGGAGFPTHVKLAAKAEYIIVNAAECEPLIRVDQELLINFTVDFLDGLNRIIEETDAVKGVIAIKAKHQDVIKYLNKQIENYKKIEVFPLNDFYPAGDEQITVYEVLKRVVPRGGIPLNVGCIVCNVETVLNVNYAMQGKTVTTTFVTITGEVNTPATYCLPIGMSYRQAMELCGVKTLDEKVGIDGGPMMGKLITDFDAPITKTTKAIIVLNRDSLLIQEKTKTIEQVLKQSRIACIQCQKCTDLCPRDLLGHHVKPHIVMRIANYGLSDFSGMKTALGCSECGACELYACPNGLSPRRVNIMIKQEMAKAGIRIDKNDETVTPSEMIDYRKIPVKRLIERVGIKKYDVKAPLEKYQYQLSRVVIPLKQHIGASAIPTVEKGMMVSEGTLIGKIEKGNLGANIHASISGVIKEITKEFITIEAEGVKI